LQICFLHAWDKAVTLVMRSRHPGPIWFFFFQHICNTEYYKSKQSARIQFLDFVPSFMQSRFIIHRNIREIIERPRAFI